MNKSQGKKHHSIERILIGFISDESNGETRGELTSEQKRYLNYLQESLGCEVVRRSSSYQNQHLRSEGLGGWRLVVLALELLTRLENLKHTRKFKSPLSSAKRFGLKTWLRVLIPPILKFCSRSFRNRLSSLKAVETVVSDKHAYLWTSVVAERADGGIIFEADFDPGPRKDWRLLPEILLEHGMSFDYIDFSGSFTFKELGLPHGEDKLDLNFMTTNTLCAYWISRKASKGLVDLLAREPWIRTIGADFLVNRLNSSKVPWRSLLLANPVITHVSMGNRKKTTIGTV
jgi:hypothetical protein